MLIPPAQARRLDRLAHRAHLFHRYAHHPLCDSYAREVIRIGRRTRVCRGCTAVAIGAAVGALGAVALPAFPTGGLILGATLAVVIVAVAVRPSPPAGATHVALAPSGPVRTQRASKVLTRALPAAVAIATAVAGARAGGLAGWVSTAVALAAMARAVFAYRRRGPDRRACASCAERSLDETCSGFRPIARREAAFARVARRLLGSSRSGGRDSRAVTPTHRYQEQHDGT